MKNQISIQNSPDAIYTCDQFGFIKTYNKAAVNLWGREPELGKELWCGSWKLFDKNGSDLPVEQHPMAVALREGRLVQGDELIIKRPDGTTRHISPYASPLVNHQGQLTGVVSMLIEVSEQEQRQRRKEEKYKTIFENASDAILICSIDGYIHEYNASCYTLLGYTSEEFSQINLNDVVEEGIIADYDNYVAILAGETKTVYRRLKRKDGLLVDMEVTVRLWENSKLIAFGRDITERKKAEEALKESEAFNKSILTSITSHIAVVDAAGNIISVNKAWEDFAEANMKCQLERGKTGSNYITAHEAAAQQGDAAAKKALDGFYKILNNETSIFEMEYPCVSNAEKRWFLLRISKFADDSPKVVVVHIDITARVKADQSMHEALERYDILTQATSDTIWDWDVVNNVMLYNDVMTKMFGYSSAAIGKDLDWWKNKIHPDDLEMVIKAVDHVFNNRIENFQLEYRFQCADGSYKFVFDRSYTIFGTNGRPYRMIGAMQDITERKNAEEEFRTMRRTIMNQKVQEQKKITRAILNAQEKERRYIAEELHDNINQMLAGTKLYLSVAGNSNPALKAALDYPVKLIEDTMHEIRLLTRKNVTPKQNINLKELLQNLVDAMFKSTTLQYHFCYDVDNEICDDELKLNIYRIVQEQSSNILKHADAQNVDVVIEIHNHVITIIVKDDGKGFDVTQKREGIGLANIINRAESFNGEAEIESSPGNGCTLYIKIPY
ncbi:MAG: PAS domain S-box protein [Bacteroidetes bacterium]|nr:PAS domain S-box protein [Bacteroidota bacterium]